MNMTFSDNVSQRVICLPLSYGLLNANVSDIVKSINNILK